jgi:hypothetical protein
MLIFNDYRPISGLHRQTSANIAMQIGLTGV